MLRTSSRGGFTILEVAISSLVFAIILLATLGATMSAQKEFDRAHSRERLDARADRGVELVREPFVSAGLSTLSPSAAPPFGSDHLTFRVPTGLLNGAVTWGPSCSVRFERGAEEHDDNRDEDGDGLVDEGHVVLVRNVGLADESRVVLATDVPELMPGEIPNGIDDNGNGLVDEKGLAFSLEGLVLTIRLCVGQRTASGHAETNVQETSITIRN